MVALKNPTYPYCNHHVGMKERGSNFNDFYWSRLKNAATFFSRPFRMFTPAKTHMAVQLAESSGGLGRKTVMRLLRATKGIKTGDAETSQARIDDACYQAAEELKKDPNVQDVMMCRAQDGHMIIPGKGHRVPITSPKPLVVYTTEEGTFVADMAPASILPEGNGLDFYESGTSITTDRIVVEEINNYTQYHETTWARIINSDGEVLWENDEIASDGYDDVRKLIKMSTMTPPTQTLPIPNRGDQHAVPPERNTSMGTDGDLTVSDLMED